MKTVSCKHSLWGCCHSITKRKTDVDSFLLRGTGKDGRSWGRRHQASQTRSRQERQRLTWICQRSNNLQPDVFCHTVWFIRGKVAAALDSSVHVNSWMTVGVRAALLRADLPHTQGEDYSHLTRLEIFTPSTNIYQARRWRVMIWTRSGHQLDREFLPTVSPDSWGFGPNWVISDQLQQLLNRMTEKQSRGSVVAYSKSRAQPNLRCGGGTVKELCRNKRWQSSTNWSRDVKESGLKFLHSAGAEPNPDC